MKPRSPDQLKSSRRIEFRPAPAPKQTLQLALVVVVVIYAMSGLVEIAGWSGIVALLPHLLDEMARDPRGYAYLAAIVALLVQRALARRYERIVVSDWGFEYRSFLQGRFEVLKRFWPDWSAPWAEIKASLEKPPALIGAQPPRLAVEVKDQTRWFAPRAWTLASAPAASANQTLDFRFRSVREKQKQLDEEVRATPLVRAIAGRGFDFSVVATQQRKSIGFDLTKHRGLNALTVALLACVFYATGDFFFLNGYDFVGNPPYAACICVAVVAFAMAMRFGEGAPTLERIVVALLFAASAGAATYPAVLRANEWTSPGAARRVAYRDAGGGHFVTDVAGYPPVDWNDYWLLEGRKASQPRVEFVILRGGLGWDEFDRTLAAKEFLR